MKYSHTIVLLAVLSQLVNASAHAEQSLSRIKTAVPVVSRDLASAPGEVELKITLNRHGYVTGAEVLRSTNFELNAPCLAAIRQWRYSNPSADSAVFVQPFQFGNGIVDNTPIAATRPKPRNKVAPTLPETLTNISGEVTVSLAIEANGTVSSVTIVQSSNEALDEACLAAAKQWTFKPATENGHAITSNAYLPFQFVGTPVEAKATVAKAEPMDKLPSLRDAVSPSIPAELKGVRGFARAVFEIDANGNVRDVTVADCSHEEFKAAILAVAKDWKFNPALHAGVAAPARVAVPFVFGPQYASL